MRFFSFLEIHLKLLAPFRPVTGRSQRLGGKTFVLTELTLDRMKNKIHGKHPAHCFAKHILPVVLPK